MKFSFFTPKASRADMEREAQQELQAAMDRAQPPTDAQRTWVLPTQEVPDFRAAVAPPPKPVRRRAIRPLFAPPPEPGRFPEPEYDESDSRPFVDGVPFEDDPYEEEMPPPPRPAARPAAPRKKAAAAGGGAASAAPRPTRPRPPAAAGGAEPPARPRPAQGPQKRMPPTRRRPPQ